MSRFKARLCRTALVCVLALGACAPSAPPPEDSEPWNVVFLLVDTLRADHLGAYGYERNTSPNFDVLAAESVLFERAIAQAGCTYPSVNSLLTSRYPARFITAEDRFNGIPDDLPSLPKILQQHGYTTAAVSASPIVTNNPSQYNPDGGFGGGFDIFYEGCQWAAAECLHRRSQALLNRLEEPFFLYLHYMEPHGPYQPPAVHPLQFVRPYAGTEGAKDFIARGNPNPIAKMMYSDGPEVDVTERDLEHLVDLYDEELFYFDGQLARLLEQLRKGGRLDRTLLILASDHGEEFLEHEHIKHCRSVYQELIHVPLLLRLPAGLPGGVRRIPGPVENLDLVPTVLDYLGIDASPYGFEGRTLRPLIEGSPEEPPEAARAFAFQRFSRAILEEDFKLIMDFEDPERRRQALYHLTLDPGEQRPVEEQHREVFRRLRRDLLLWIEAQEGDAERGVRAAREAEQQLKALGYLQ